MSATNVIDYGQYNWWPYGWSWPYEQQPQFIMSTSTAPCSHCWCGDGPKRNNKPHVQCCTCSDVTLKKGSER